MSKIVDRELILPKLDDNIKLVLETEYHHNHPIVLDHHGGYRWKKDDLVDELVRKMGDISNVIEFFYLMGYDKNSEIYRKMYRSIGYSLYGYW